MSTSLRPALLVAALLSSPGASVATRAQATTPPFPLDFEGRSCDSYARCYPVSVVLYADGRMEETRSGMTGIWTWDPATGTFTAWIDDLIHSVLIGEKVPGKPCVKGPWTSDRVEVYGVWRMCRV